MLGQLGGEVEVGEHVPIEHQHALLEQAGLVGKAHRTRRSERLVLDHVAQPHAPVDVAEHGAHAVGEEAAGQDRLADAVARAASRA